jgi:phage shock protein A
MTLVGQIQFHMQEVCRLSSRAAHASQDGREDDAKRWMERVEDSKNACHSALERLAELAQSPDDLKTS